MIVNTDTDDLSIGAYTRIKTSCRARGQECRTFLSKMAEASCAVTPKKRGRWPILQ